MQNTIVKNTNAARISTPTPTATVAATATPIPGPASTRDDAAFKTFGDDFTSFLLIIAFLLVAAGQMLLAWKRQWDLASAKVVAITTIGFFGVFAALTVDNDKNGSAVFALLGTIAGYMLGRDSRTPTTKPGTQGSAAASTHDEGGPEAL